MTLAYDGAGFHGWQIQPGLPTIQGTLAEALASVTGERVLPQGAGRTDAGVHALGQTASFPLRAAIPPENLRRAVNRILPAAIRVLRAEPAPPEFHARHSAKGKLYRYRVLTGGLCPPSLARYVACCHWRLDLAAMRQGAQAIVGEHDFTAFAASDPDRAAASRRAVKSDLSVPSPASNVRRIEASQWEREAPASAFGERIVADGPDDAAGSELLTYRVSGNGFLHHMVRNLAGTFLDVGRGRLAPSAVAEILAGRDRARAGPTAPASGLCLIKVMY